MEAVYDKETGLLVDDNEYTGSFNFHPSGVFGLKILQHYRADMAPFFENGGN